MREVLAITKALSDETRLRILMSLRNGELCVCQVIGLLELAPSTVSKHMSILHQAGLVEARKEGRWMYYRLAAESPPARWVLESLAKDRQVAEDARRLKSLLCCDRGELSQRYHRPVQLQRSSHDKPCAC